MSERIKLHIRAFNRFLSTPVAVLIILMLMFVYFAVANYQVSTHIAALSTDNKHLSEQLSTAVLALKTDSGAKQDKLQSHIDCIITFFGRPDRLNLSIADVCDFLPSGTSQGASGQAVSPQSSQRNASSSGAATSGAASQSSTQPTPPSTSQQPNPVPMIKVTQPLPICLNAPILEVCQ